MGEQPQGEFDDEDAEDQVIRGHEDGAEAGHDAGESLKPENDRIQQDESGDRVCKKLRLDQRQGMFTEPQQVCAPGHRIEILQGITRRAEFRAKQISELSRRSRLRCARVRANHCRTVPETARAAPLLHRRSRIDGVKHKHVLRRNNVPNAAK